MVEPVTRADPKQRQTECFLNKFYGFCLFGASRSLNRSRTYLKGPLPLSRTYPEVRVLEARGVPEQEGERREERGPTIDASLALAQKSEGICILMADGLSDERKAVTARLKRLLPLVSYRLLRGFGGGGRGAEAS